jgi:excisionase family DNA binding protein
MKTNTTKELLTYQELAERLKTPIQTLRTLVSKNEIPFIKKKGIGVRFCWMEILGWMEMGD